MPTHADILEPDELALWQQYRQLRSGSGLTSGHRQTTLDLLAKRTGRDAEELNDALVDMKRRLVEGGAIPAHRHYVHQRPGGAWGVSSVVDGSAAHRDVVARGGSEAESVRYAHNLATARNVDDMLGDDQQAAFVAALVDCIAMPTGRDDADERGVVTVELGGGASAAFYAYIGAERTTFGFHVVQDDGARFSWTGPVNHASFIAGELR